MWDTIDNIRNAQLPNFIDGDWRPPLGGRYLDSFNPATGEVWHAAADSGAEDVQAAVAAAKRALHNPHWRDLTQTARGNLLFRLADLIAEHSEDLARIETEDNGKLLKETRAQIAYLCQYYRYFAGMADKMEGGTPPLDKPEMINFTLREPIGVVAIIVPWNSPLYMMTVALAPCLAAGNAAVIKPSEHTSASAIAFAGLIKKAGFPDGVFNVVTGFGDSAGGALSAHHDVNKVTFTGSPETGRLVAAAAATHLAPCNLELGGKSPHVVFADTDMERAVNGVMAGIFAAGGQTCVAGSRCLVESSIYDDFVNRLVDRAKVLRIGDPTSDDSHMGPLALEAQREKVARYVEYGKADGAKLVLGGGYPSVAPPLSGGWFFEPTVFTDVTNDMRIAKDEIFGPVAGIMRFDGEEDLIAQANDSFYGLAAGIWTGNISRAMRFARAVDAGTVWVNTYRTASFVSPAGGFKGSGYGKQNGMEAIRQYSRLKSVMIDYSDKMQDAFVMRL